MNMARHIEAAKQGLTELQSKLHALRAECLARGGAVTSAQAERLQELQAGFATLREGIIGEAEDRAKALFGERYVSAEDYYTHLGIAREQIFPLAPLKLLDKSFIAELKGTCPFDNDKLLHDSHLLLTPPPENFCLNALSEAVGGQAGQVLYSDWFLTQPIGAKPCGNLPFALIPATGEFAPETKKLGWADSKAALREHYPEYVQADALRLSTALILYERKTGIRLHENGWGWCEDLYGAGSSSALLVGDFSADGLMVFVNSLVLTLGWLGCAALRNIGTR